MTIKPFPAPRLPHLPVIVSLLLLSACASIQLGHDFDIQILETKVVSGESTKGDIQTWLGAPTSTGITVHGDGKRTEKWTYYHAHGKLPGLKDARLKILEIQFDDQDQVYSYNWTE